MKTIYFALLLLLPIFTLQAQEEVLTNQQIIEMLDLGFEEDIIITKIQTSRTDFNTDISQLKALKDKGASSKIISAMMKQDSETPVEQNNQSGIYFESEGQKVKVLPSVFSASKTSTLASGLTYGIASAKVKSIINNSSSRNVINNEQPAFYFYFSPSDVLGQGGLD